MGYFSKRYIGIEIGATTVKVVGLTAGTRPLFIGCKETVFAQKEAASISTALKEALRTAAPHRLSSAPAVLVIPEKEVFRKTIELPVLKDAAEKREAIRLELAEFLPENEKVEFDYQVLGTVSAEGIEQCMVVSVSQDLLSTYTKAIALSGLHLQAIDTYPAALGRAVVPLSEKKPAILVSVESSTATVSLYHRGIVWVSSTLNQGVGEEETADSGRTTRLSGALVDEIDHVVKFYENRTAGGKAEMGGVRLIGPGYAVSQLKELLDKELETSVSLAKSQLTVPAFCGLPFLPAMGAALYSSYEKL